MLISLFPNSFAESAQSTPFFNCLNYIRMMHLLSKTKIENVDIEGKYKVSLQKDLHVGDVLTVIITLFLKKSGEINTQNIS
jgi:hypothetical protein